nr:uncharacterized protein LOC120961977 isoform X2 [Aegilops tauschii subsp. strangulata]
MGLGSYNDGSRGDKDHFATSPNCVTELKEKENTRRSGSVSDQATSLTFNCQDLTGRSLSYQGKQPSAEIEGASPARVLVSWWFPTSGMGEAVSSAARSTCWRPHRHQPICSLLEWIWFPRDHFLCIRS